LVEAPAIQRRDNGSIVADKWIIRGLEHPDTNITAADIYFTINEDGSGYTQVIHDTVDHVGDGSLRKRGDGGAGYKFNFHVKSFNDFGYDLNIWYTIYTVLADVVAADWAIKADYYRISEYFPIFTFPYIFLRLFGVGFRIIPEIRGFGNEYKDVNACGPLTGIVYDEL